MPVTVKKCPMESRSAYNQLLLTVNTEFHSRGKAVNQEPCWFVNSHHTANQGVTTAPLCIAIERLGHLYKCHTTLPRVRPMSTRGAGQSK
jgi:hypothetical protein